MIVRHGDYYTFYANIIDPSVKQGDKVKTGQALGKIYTDPDTGISTMHFQLWQNQQIGSSSLDSSLKRYNQAGRGIFTHPACYRKMQLPRYACSRTERLLLMVQCFVV